METASGQLEWPRLYYDGIEHLLWNPDWIRGLQAAPTERRPSSSPRYRAAERLPLLTSPAR